MNTDEPDLTASTTNTNGNRTLNKKTPKTNQKFISKSITAKNSTADSTSTFNSTSSYRTTKRLNTTNQQQQQQLEIQINRNQKTTSSTSLSSASTLLQNITSKSLSSLSQSAFLFPLTSSAIERFSRTTYTNTNVVNQLNLLTTNTSTEMPTRTTMKTALKSTETSSTTTNVIKSKLSSTLTQKLDEMSSKPAIRFHRSYSVPILKIDDAARARIYAINEATAELGCDKNFTSFNHNNRTKPPQQKHGDKTLIDEYASPETSLETISILNTTTTTNSTTVARATQLRPVSVSKINSNNDDDADDVDVDEHEHDITITDHADSGQHHIREDLRFGCAHYKRRAMFVTPCCNKFYKCRFCHDENESHHFDRKTLNELICSECNTRQKVQEACVKCGVRFGKYTCLICNLFDDEDKKQYHCDACGICRIGGAENFFHCEVCNMCLPIQLKIDGHKCVENISRSHCPVCLGDIHTSRIPCHIPDCGHLLHKMCFDQLLASGHYACPTCQTSLIDMTTLWEFLDAQASQMPLPKKYENQKIHIFCNDCQRTSKTNFHFIGLKCMECGAYNTTQDVKRRVSLVPDETNTA